MQNSTCAFRSPNSASLMRSGVLPPGPLTSTPWPGAMANFWGLAGSSETLLAAIHSPVGLRQPARSLPLNKTTVLPATGLVAKARAMRVMGARSWQPTLDADARLLSERLRVADPRSWTAPLRGAARRQTQANLGALGVEGMDFIWLEVLNHRLTRCQAFGNLFH